MFESFFDVETLDISNLILDIATADAAMDVVAADPATGTSTGPTVIATLELGVDPFDAATDNATCTFCDIPEADDSESVIVMGGFSLNDVDIFA